MDKLYLPSQYINQNYYYRISSGFISIITNNGCTGTGSNKYCDCYSYYYDLNVVSNSYKCQSYITNNTILIPNNILTSNVWYRKDLAFILIIFLILFIFIIKYPMRLFMRLFGRWLKL